MDPPARPELVPGARTDLPEGLVTFVFTDIEGSTRLLHELGPAGYAAALADHRAIIRAAIRAETGVEVDNQGDAFFLAFPSADGAVAAAAAITAELARGPIRVRMGIHSGTPHLTGEGYVGEDVHLGARIAATAHGGQVVLSDATRRLLHREFATVDLGAHRVKDFAASIAIHQLGDEAFPALRSIGATNLPMPISPFLGRAEELAAVCAELAAGRLVTLTGPGGTGKTRLAIEAARAVTDRHPAGTFWVGCSAIREPALVLDAIAETLGTSDDLATAIASRRMLLVIDNLEQVVSVGPELQRLIVACPNLSVLITSRERLGIAGERDHPVPSLDESEAIELFCQRSGLEPTDEIATLCRRLDALPLAVELAAARTRSLSPNQILARLGSRLDLLRGSRDVDGRQGTLRSTIDWSHDLLDSDERALFRGLAVFAGGCHLEAAERVASADLDVLDALVGKSLLRFTHERFWMLESIRAYALEQLARGEDRDRRREAFVGWAVDHVEAQDRLLRGPRQIPALEALDVELDNLRAALALAVDFSDADLARRLAQASAWWMARRGRGAELRRWIRASLALPGGDPGLRGRTLLGLAFALGIGTDHAEIEAIGRDGIALAEEIGDVALRAGFLEVLAVTAGGDEGLAMLEEAGAIFAATGHHNEAVRTAINRGAVAINGERYELAIEVLTDALARVRTVGNRHGAGVTLMNLAVARLMTDRDEEAERDVENAVTELESVGDAIGLTVMLPIIALVEARRGDPDLAALLIAACDANMASLEEDLEPGDRRVREAVDTAVSELEPSRRAGLAVEGRALTTIDAIERWRRARPGS